METNDCKFLPSAALAKMNSISILENHFCSNESTKEVMNAAFDAIDLAIENGSTKCQIEVTSLNDDDKFAFIRYLELNGYKVEELCYGDWIVADWTNA